MDLLLAFSEAGSLLRFVWTIGTTLFEASAFFGGVYNEETDFIYKIKVWELSSML